MTITWIILSIVLLSTLIALFRINFVLSKCTEWSLADALSEEIEITALDNEKKPIMQNGVPVMYKVKCASISRLIALMGMTVILLIFFGFGLSAIYSFTVPKEVSGHIIDAGSVDLVLKFLLGGMALFAPYAVNQVSGIFESFFPKAEQPATIPH